MNKQKLVWLLLLGFHLSSYGMWSETRSQSPSLQDVMEKGDTADIAPYFAHHPEEIKSKSPLCHAVRSNKLSHVKAVLTAGADVNAQDQNGSALHCAIALNNMKNNKSIILCTLIAAGADVNLKRPCDGRTPLHMAAAWGNDNIIEILLNAGADINAVDAEGNTPADLARFLVGNSRFCKCLCCLFTYPSDLCARLLNAHQTNRYRTLWLLERQKQKNDAEHISSIVMIQ